MGNLKHLGLFEGIGGFSLAARWMGWETVAWCEWDKNCQRVLKYHFPNASQHDDITKTDFTRYAGQIDILTGGFPCQPYSTAGKRLGKDDDRHLWPEMLRAIREVRPRWVVGENVRGLVSWNGGMVFDEVQADLEAEGYEVLPFILPACAVNAPHRRDRVWFVAHSNTHSDSANVWPNFKPDKIQDVNRPKNIRAGVAYRASIAQNPIEIRRDSEQPEGKPGEREQWQSGAGDNVRVSDVANANKEQFKDGAPINRRWKAKAEIGTGLHDRFARFSDNRSTPNANEIDRPERWMHTNGPGQAERHTCTRNSRDGRGNWQDFPTQPPVCGGNDGVSRRLDGITFPKWREFAIGAYGNAIVPQVAHQIFKAIEQWEILKDGQPTK